MKRKHKILIAPSSFAEADRSPFDKLLVAGFQVVDNPYKRKLTKSELLVLLGNDVAGVLAGLETYDKEVLENTSLRVISRVGSGLANIDMDAAARLGIMICNTPDAPVNAVAEVTVGALLNLLRSIPQMNADLHNDKWVKRIGHQLEGKNICIIGFGRIGRRVAELLTPFRANIIFVDPFVDRHECPGFQKLELNEALPIADVVSLHCSGENCILDKNEFDLMKRGVFVLNASRGGLISEPPLLEMLENGKIAGAWVDTFQTEPYTGPLCKFSNVILTPHIGSYTFECRKQMENEAVDNLIISFEKLERGDAD